MMVDREKLARRLMATYLEELQDHVDALNRNLLAMEDGPAADERPELFNLLFRAAHSLKGASRAVNVELIEKVCHQMEEVLGAARDGTLELTPAHYVVLFKGIDGIEDAGNRLRESSDLADSPLHELLPDLTAAAAGDFSPGAAAAATPEDSRPSPAAGEVEPEVELEPPAATESGPESKSESTSGSEAASEQAPASAGAAEQDGAAEAETDATRSRADAESSVTPRGEAPAAERNVPAATKKATRKSARKGPRKSRKKASRKVTKKVVKKAAKKAAKKRSSSKEAVTPPAPQSAAAAPPDAAETPLPAGRPASAAPSATSRTATGSVRVAAEKLDTLLAQSGELLVARRRIQSRVGDIEDLRQIAADCRREWRAAAKPIEVLTNREAQAGLAEVQHILETINLNRQALARLERGLDRLGMQLSRDGGLLNQACTALEDEVHRVRMLPFAEACGGLDRAVRDVARSTGKQVALKIGGKDVELDRAILEGLKDPLMHLVRNGVDHGIEPPEQRLAAGKPAEAQLTVSASLRGAQVEIVVEDDGRGFDIQRIREKARSKGLPEPQDDHAVAQLVFMAGFSTASTVTNISGRGVGLDVVQAQIEALQGSVDLSFAAGRGSRFTLNLPLTLTTTRAIMVRAGNQTYAIPTVSVQQIVRIDPSDVSSVGRRHMLTLGGTPIPISRLTETLGMEGDETDSEAAKLLVIIMGSGQIATATIVDELLAEQEITIKHLGRRIRHVRHISGGTLLPSGETALVLNAANFMRTQLNTESYTPLVTVQVTQSQETPPRLLVVDDSVTTRALMQAILESAGFNVQTAADGRFALEKLDQGQFDLVVSDVDMPRMNGFGLTEAIRKSKRLAKTPVILVTSRATDEDKARGLQAGADGYIVKKEFESHGLVETIHQLL